MVKRAGGELTTRLFKISFLLHALCSWHIPPAHIAKNLSLIATLLAPSTHRIAAHFSDELFGTHRGSLALSTIDKVSVDRTTLYLKTVENKDYKFRVAKTHSSSSTPTIKKWYEAIQIQKSIAYNKNNAKDAGRSRNASISGSYVSPTPTITHILHDSTSAVLATDTSYGTTVVSSTVPDSETITILLSDGTKVPPIPIPSSASEVSTTVPHPTLGDVTITTTYSRQLLRKTPTLVQAIFSLPIFSFGLAHAVLAASETVGKLPVTVPNTISELFPTIFVAVIVISLFFSPTVLRMSLCITLKLPGWDQGKCQKTEVLTDEDLKADAAIASASATPDEKTCLATIADAFSAAYNEETKEIEIEKLLVAAKSFLEILRALGPAMALGVNDFQGNCKKANSFYEKDKVAHSNMKALLTAEKATGIHKPGGVNKDPSSAAGLLWMRRSVSFQVAIFNACLESPNGTFVEASEKAYVKELEPFHGWLLKKIFGKVIANVPSKTDFEEKIAPNVTCNRSEVVDRDIKYFVAKVGPIVQVWREVFADLDLEDVRKV